MFKKKKKRTLTGRLMYPIKIGCKAIFDDGTSLIQTSAVERIYRQTKNKVSFETQNTRYVLHLTDVA